MAQKPKRLLFGAIPSPRWVLAGATPHQIIGPTPGCVLHKPDELLYWGNDIYGDCVSAEEAFAKACIDPKVWLTDQNIEDWASANGFLQAAVVSDVLDRMWSVGIPCGAVRPHPTAFDGAKLAVDWTNRSILRNAITHGPVKLGVAGNQLEATCQQAPGNGWLAKGYQPDNLVNHCVSACGFGAIGLLSQALGTAVPAGVDPNTDVYAIFTWSSIGFMDEASMLAITYEAWLRRPTTFIEGPFGTDLSQ